VLVPFTDILAAARDRNAAAAAFTCYDLETAAAVLGTAAKRDRPVIVLVSPSSVRGDDGAAFLSGLLGYADRAAAQCCLQVDHIDDLEQIGRAVELGVGAVMADGSRLPLDENIAFVRAATELTRRADVAIEAELGRVEGDEDLVGVAPAGRLTDPADAERFLAETNADCLAISIGNAHGAYSSPPQIDWERLERIRAQVSGPLSLHGASGIPDASVRRAVELGIGKANVNTELRFAYLRATAEAVGAVLETAAVVDLHHAQKDAVARVVAAKLDLFEPGASA
jgi:tagatose 1,6-diphosphate aldolase GatY/KbaY